MITKFNTEENLQYPYWIKGSRQGLQQDVSQPFMKHFERKQPIKRMETEETVATCRNICYFLFYLYWRTIEAEMLLARKRSFLAS